MTHRGRDDREVESRDPASDHEVENVHVLRTVGAPYWLSNVPTAPHFCIRWQDAGTGREVGRGLAIADDGSILLAGYTTGDWDGENAGLQDFAAVKLDSYSNESWRWQVSPRGAGGRYKSQSVLAYGKF